jgi:phosphinothricin acetyltransferase
VRIAAMTAQHAAEVLAIYQAGIDEGNATFETTAPSWEAFDTSLPIAASSALPGSAW